jgi:hypothetical protein
VNKLQDQITGEPEAYAQLKQHTTIHPRTNERIQPKPRDREVKDQNSNFPNQQPRDETRRDDTIRKTRDKKRTGPFPVPRLRNRALQDSSSDELSPLPCCPLLFLGKTQTEKVLANGSRFQNRPTTRDLSFTLSLFILYRSRSKASTAILLQDPKLSYRTTRTSMQYTWLGPPGTCTVHFDQASPHEWPLSLALIIGNRKDVTHTTKTKSSLM